MPLALRLVALCLVSSACASRAPAGTTAPITASRAAALPLAPMRLVHVGHVEGALSADGTVTLGDRVWARFDGDRLVTPEGRELARRDGDTLTLAGAAAPATLSADGVLTSPDGQTMALDREGHVVFTSPAHPGETVVHATTLSGVTDATRTTAVVLAAALMMRARELRADPPESP